MQAIVFPDGNFIIFTRKKAGYETRDDKSIIYKKEAVRDEKH